MRSTMYHLIGEIDEDEGQAVEPFPEPAPGATITFWQGAPTILYGACLVKVHSQSGHTLKFYGVNVVDEEPDTSKLHEVDLRDTAAVWPSEPSSNWSAWTSTNCYLVLLLGTKLIDEEPTLQAAQAEDGGKWPRSSGDKFIPLRTSLVDVRKRLQKLREGLDEKAQKRLDTLFEKYL